MGVTKTAGQSVYNSITTGSTLTLTLTNNPTAGNAVTVGFMFFDGVNSSGGAVTVKDASSNVYTISPNSPSQAQALNNGAAYGAYLLNAPANANKAINIVFGRAVSVATGWADEFTVSGGTLAFASDAAGSGANSSAINTPTITVGAANTLLYAYATPGNQISSVAGAWTVSPATSLPTADGFGSGAEYQLAASANTAVAFVQNTTPSTPTWDSIGMAFSFTATGGGTAPRVTGPITLLGAQ